MAQKPQNRLIRWLIAAHVGLSLVVYFLACIAPIDNSTVGYQFFEFYWNSKARVSIGHKLIVVGLLQVNLMWLLSIGLYFANFRLGQLMMSLPGAISLVFFLYMSYSVTQSGGISLWPPACLFWAVSMLVAFYAGLINYATHPRPQALTDEDA
ncbi:MAG: hypothetical protein ACRC8S_00330 [Fimbriiglobus sp.]